MKLVQFPPANMQLRRAQLVLMLAVLVPTVMMRASASCCSIVGRSTTTMISGVLVLTFCTSGITGYILGSIFVGKGASLVRVQNDFVSSVSHELRTPLTSIRLLIESLRTGRLEDEDRDQGAVAARPRDRPSRGAGRSRARAVAAAVQLRLRARADRGRRAGRGGARVVRRHHA